ncbi:MAG: cytochrome c biogenesis protein CcsA [bacterium]|nr:MAG: cytochrome c biogenesis protein CcsA [bacterium]
MEATSSALHMSSLAFYGLSLVVYSLSRAVRGLPQKVAVWPALAGLFCQLVLLVLRWRAGNHLPVTGLFETQHFLALWVVMTGLYFSVRYWAYNFLPAAVGLAMAALIFASRGPKAVTPLTPAIDTPLFLIHIATSFAAYGLFGIAALVALFRLIGISGSPVNAEQRMLDESIYLGYILFTWAMIAGSLWAYLAWGSYWTWRIKGLWSWILWFYYSGVLHVRKRSGWQARPLDLLAIAGYALVLFTYLGLGLLFKTSHPLL